MNPSFSIQAHVGIDQAIVNDPGIKKQVKGHRKRLKAEIDKPLEAAAAVIVRQK